MHFHRLPFLRTASDSFSNTKLTGILLCAGILYITANLTFVSTGEHLTSDHMPDETGDHMTEPTADFVIPLTDPLVGGAPWGASEPALATEFTCARAM